MLKITGWSALVLGVAAALFVSISPAQPAAAPQAALVYKQSDIDELMKRVMNFQVKAYGEKPNVSWTSGAFWAGVMAAYQQTGDQAFYDATKKWGDTVNWKIDLGDSPLHGDSIAVGQAYLDIYEKDKDPKEIKELSAALANYLDKKTLAKGEAGGPSNKTDGLPATGRNVWWWCDSLFMAPATFVRMAKTSGDHRYLDYVDTQYWDSIAFLFDPAEGLIYRDANYFPDKKKSPTGKKIFWSRGNGWVYAGIIRTLDYIPESDPHRQKYIDLFKQMTAAIVKYQGTDGLWRPSVTEPTWITEPETSGSGFFCFGLLAGINRGYLDKATYLPLALHAWAGLTSHVNADGLLGYAQNVGASPGHTKPDVFHDYANGAFLLAGSELYKMNLSAADVAKIKW